MISVDLFKELKTIELSSSRRFALGRMVTAGLDPKNSDTSCADCENSTGENCWTAENSFCQNCTEENCSYGGDPSCDPNGSC